MASFRELKSALESIGCAPVADRTPLTVLSAVSVQCLDLFPRCWFVPLPGIFEGCGYMARMHLIMDRIFEFGLSVIFYSDSDRYRLWCSGVMDQNH